MVATLDEHTQREAFKLALGHQFADLLCGDGSDGQQGELSLRRDGLLGVNLRNIGHDMLLCALRTIGDWQKCISTH